MMLRRYHEQPEPAKPAEVEETPAVVEPEPAKPTTRAKSK